MNTILQDGKHCYVTGDTEGLHKHHCLNGPNRRLAEEDGLWVWLRWDRHIANSPWDTPHNNPKVDLFYKKLAQRTYEETHTREEWMARYGRNYLDWEAQDEVNNAESDD